jgi:hypothetical protein
VKIMEEGKGVNDKNADPARNFAMAATGTVKYEPDLDGLDEAEIVINGYPKPPDWNHDPHTVCDMRKKIAQDNYRQAKRSARTGKPRGL